MKKVIQKKQCTMNIYKTCIKFCGAILLSFAISSCEDVLDEIPSDKVDIGKILNKPASVEEFKNRAYDNLDASFTGKTSGQLIEAYSDDAFRAGVGITYSWHLGLLTPQSNMLHKNLWKSYWEGIRKCNLALEYLPQSTVSKDELSDFQINQWMDEVRVIRAWYHFELIRNFGPMPFIDFVIEPSFNGWNDLTRPTYDEISKRIIKECDDVIENNTLPFKYSSATLYGRINKAVPYALKARVALYNASVLNNPQNDLAKWQEAANAAKACRDALIASGEFGLLAIEDYANLFNEGISTWNSEVVFRSSKNGTAEINGNNSLSLEGLGSSKFSGNCGAVPTQELVDCFELKDGTLPVASYNADHTLVVLNSGYTESPGDDIYNNRDARLAHAIVYNGATYGKYKGIPASDPDLVVYTFNTYDQTIGDNSTVATGFNSLPTSTQETDKRRSCTGYYGRKYRNPYYWGASTGSTNAHKIYFRLAEVYLNLAEAECEQGNLSAAIEALDVIRLRAGQPALASVPGFLNTKEFILERIRNERRVELCFEGHRFYDQRRWKILKETNTVISGMKISSSDTTQTGTFSYERVKIDVPRASNVDKYLVLPIPSNEAIKLRGLGQPDAWQ